MFERSVGNATRRVNVTPFYVWACSKTASVGCGTTCRYKKTSHNRLVLKGFLVHESSLIDSVTA
ncbi:hypothetical protein BEM40_016230 [Escherichia sp. MOD1-EC5451]|nr:hypothetical protein BEM40_016230 [Escherichia sp. MOD1-EC5451]